MKNINYKQIRKFLTLLIVSQVLMLTLFVGVDKAQDKLSNWMFQTYTQPFLK